MKKMLLATALALPSPRMLNRRLLFKTNQLASSTETITIISSFLELGGKKTVDAAKICGSAENVVKTETSKHS